MNKLAEVVDEEGRSTLIPFHRVNRVVKATSMLGTPGCVVFCMDGNASVVIPPGPDAEHAWALYREWVAGLK